MSNVLIQCPCELITEDDPGHVEPHEGVIGGVVDLPLCERVSPPVTGLDPPVLVHLDSEDVRGEALQSQLTWIQGDV